MYIGIGALLVIIVLVLLIRPQGMFGIR